MPDQLPVSRELIEAVTRAIEQRGCKRLANRELRFQCPHPERHANGDAHPSADWNPAKAVWTCRACGAGGGVNNLATLLGLDVRPPARGSPGTPPRRGGRGALPPDQPRNRATPPVTGCTLEQYAVKARLPLDFLRGLGLTEIAINGAKAVRIPYKDAHGQDAAIRFRTARDRPHDGSADQRFRWKNGSKPLLYGLWRLDQAQQAGYVILVEGESDAHTLWLHGEPALGVPGANNWNDDRDAPHLEGIERIYAVVEPDAGGEAFRDALGRSSIRDRLWLVTLNGFKDPNELHQADPEAFAEQWQTAIASARSWQEIEAELAEQARRELWEQCRDLAVQPDILPLFLRDLKALGVVGEERTVQLVYLAMTSRILDRPVSVAIKGPSSAGKSFTSQKVIEFFPASAYYSLTAMSERALIYSEESLRHRMMVIFEAAGLQSDFASYLMRSLLSEGRLDYETVEKTPSGLRPRKITREGPTGLIVTTTAVSLHPENETRLLSVTVKDTPEQTVRILQEMGREDRPSVDLAPWRALQAWLALSPAEVTIPYGPRLLDLIPPVAVRLRRDVSAVLRLIKAHAILHQASRETDERGRIVATIADYAAVRSVVSEIVQEVVSATVSTEVWEVVEAVRELQPAYEEGVPQAALVRRLHLDKGTISRRVQAAQANEYLRNLESRRGRPARLVVGEPMPAELEILPRPEVLHGCAVAGGDDTPSPPPESWRCRCGAHSVKETCWNCGSSQPPQ